MKRPLYSRTGSTRTGSTRTGSSSTGYKTGSTIVNGGTVRSGNTPITRQNTIDDLYSDILKHNAGGDSLNQLLAMLGIEQEKGLSPGQRDDWNKQLLDAQLQHYMDLEKRQYTAETLGEQRLYDSPMNQLARLMGAGISRDAAIAMLQGGQQATLAESAVSPTGISASESKANGVNNALGIAGAVINAASAITGLVSLGFTVPQAIQQTNYLKNQNYLTDSQIQAYKSTGQAFSILKTAGAAASAFGSVSSAVDAINELAKNGNTDAASFVASGGVEQMKQNAPFASTTLGNLYKSERSSADYAKDYRRRARLEEGQIALNSISYDQVRADIRIAEERINEILASEDFIRAQTETQKSLGLSAAIQADKDYHLAYSSIEDPNTGQNLGTGLQILTDKVLWQTYNDACLAAKCTDPEFQDTLFQQLFTNAESSALLNMVNILRNSAGLDFAEQCPRLAQWCMGMESCGVFEYLDKLNGSKVTESTSTSVRGMTSSESVQKLNPDIVDWTNKAQDQFTPQPYKKRKLNKN